MNPQQQSISVHCPVKPPFPRIMPELNRIFNLQTLKNVAGLNKPKNLIFNQQRFTNLSEVQKKYGANEQGVIFHSNPLDFFPGYPPCSCIRELYNSKK
jgi:hypothetical protein